MFSKIIIALVVFHAIVLLILSTQMSFLFAGLFTFAVWFVVVGVTAGIFFSVETKRDASSDLANA
jgi:uncharacterized membrane protein